METGVCLQTLQGHGGRVFAAAVAPDGKHAASGSKDQTVRIWDLESGTCLRTLRYEDEVHFVAVTPDGRKAVTREGVLSKAVDVWDLEPGVLLWTLEADSGWIESIVVTPDGRYVVAANVANELFEPAEVKVWDLTSGMLCRTLRGHAGWIHAIAVTPDGHKVVSGSWDKTVRVWDLATGTCTGILEGHEGHVLTADVSPDGRLVVTGGNEGTVRVWDLATGECLQILQFIAPVSAAKVAPDGKYVVAKTSQTLQVRDLVTGQEVASFLTDGDVRKWALGPEGIRIAAGGLKGLYLLVLENISLGDHTPESGDGEFEV
jgi:WD40 repeat protein